MPQVDSLSLSYRQRAQMMRRALGVDNDGGVGRRCGHDEFSDRLARTTSVEEIARRAPSHGQQVGARISHPSQVRRGRREAHKDLLHGVLSLGAGATAPEGETEKLCGAKIVDLLQGRGLARSEPPKGHLEVGACVRCRSLGIRE